MWKIPAFRPPNSGETRRVFDFLGGKSQHNTLYTLPGASTTFEFATCTLPILYPAYASPGTQKSAWTSIQELESSKEVVSTSAGRGFSSHTMRRSVILSALNGEPSQSASKASSFDNARLASGGGYGPLLGRKPFKPPSSINSSLLSSRGRKRKRVDYGGMGGDADAPNDRDAELGSDDDGGKPKKPKTKKGQEINYKGVDEYGRSLNAETRSYAVYTPDPEALKKGFNIPQMKNAKGEIIENRVTLAALGTRRAIDIPPRPLYDPMAEHAIVLYDPTIDDRDPVGTEEAEAEAAENPQAKQRGPHKCLAAILGLDKQKKKVDVKVPVVIDPRLAKVLRPHQVEGVKVSIHPA